MYIETLSPELAILKAIAEEHKQIVKRRSAEQLDAPLEVNYMNRRSHSLTHTAAKHANARLTVERVMSRTRRLAGNVELPELAFFPMLEFAQCTDSTRPVNCSAPFVNIYRMADGSCNNLNQPLKDAANTAFSHIRTARTV